MIIQKTPAASESPAGGLSAEVPRPLDMESGDEVRAVAERYARRSRNERYNRLRPDVWQTFQERQRVMLQLFAKHGINDVSKLNLTEVGCGGGGNLLELLQLGFAPERLQGLELLPNRFERARRVLPIATRLVLGDAAQAAIGPASQDLVLQAMVFSSLLDDQFQQRLADSMWRWVKPGGAVLWYDFTMNNPHNPDVRGVSVKRLRSFWPEARVEYRRLTLAPPLARIVCCWHPTLYHLLNVMPLLRTHVLAWVGKPAC